jgi:hypothetical protein
MTTYCKLIRRETQKTGFYRQMCILLWRPILSGQANAPYVNSFRSGRTDPNPSHGEMLTQQIVISALTAACFGHRG